MNIKELVNKLTGFADQKTLAPMIKYLSDLAAFQGMSEAEKQVQAEKELINFRKEQQEKIFKPKKLLIALDHLLKEFISERYYSNEQHSVFASAAANAFILGDIDRAFYYAQRSIEEGQPLGYYYLMAVYKGQNKTKELKNTFEAFSKLPDSSQLHYASYLMYRNNIGFEQGENNYANSMGHLLRAVNNDYPPAMTDYAYDLIALFNFSTKDKALAFIKKDNPVLYKNLVQANNRVAYSNEEIQNNLDVHLNKQANKAQELLNKAFKKGYKLAAKAMASLLTSEKSIGYQADVKKWQENGLRMTQIKHKLYTMARLRLNSVQNIETIERSISSANQTIQNNLEELIGELQNNLVVGFEYVNRFNSTYEGALSYLILLNEQNPVAAEYLAKIAHEKGDLAGTYIIASICQKHIKDNYKIEENKKLLTSCIKLIVDSKEDADVSNNNGEEGENKRKAAAIVCYTKANMYKYYIGQEVNSANAHNYDNNDEIKRLYQKAIDQKYPPAMYEMALISRRTDPSSAGWQTAYDLLTDAANLGYVPAYLELAKLIVSMPSDIREIRYANLQDDDMKDLLIQQDMIDQSLRYLKLAEEFHDLEFELGQTNGYKRKIEEAINEKREQFQKAVEANVPANLDTPIIPVVNIINRGLFKVTSSSKTDELTERFIAYAKNNNEDQLDIIVKNGFDSFEIIFNIEDEDVPEFYWTYIENHIELLKSKFTSYSERNQLVLINAFERHAKNSVIQNLNDSGLLDGLSKLKSSPN